MICVRNLKQTCTAAPSQWEAVTEDGRPVYIRYRHGQLSVHVGPPGGSVEDAIDTSPIFEQDVGEKLGSWLDWQEVVEATGIKLIAP